MPSSIRNLPAASAKAIVRRALVRSGARPGEAFEAPERVTRFAGAHRDVTDVTATLDALVSDGDVETSGGKYRLMAQGLTAFRHAPSPRLRATA